MKIDLHMVAKVWHKAQGCNLSYHRHMVAQIHQKQNTHRLSFQSPLQAHGCYTSTRTENENIIWKKLTSTVAKSMYWWKNYEILQAQGCNTYQGTWLHISSTRLHPIQTTREMQLVAELPLLDTHQMIWKVNYIIPWKKNIENKSIYCTWLQKCTYLQL